MAVMEIDLPSGFIIYADGLETLKSSPGVKKVETRKGDAVVVIYFDSLDSTNLCPTVNAYRKHKVAYQRPASVAVYDFYDTTRVAQAFYKVRQLHTCDICEEDDCDKVACANRAAKELMLQHFLFNYVKILVREYL